MIAEPIIETRNVSKRFGGFKALTNVSVQIRPGMLTSIIGPNGAGKSTFFNTLSGAFAPSAGQIFFMGRDITGMPAHEFAHTGIAKSLAQRRSRQGPGGDQVWSDVGQLQRRRPARPRRQRPQRGAEGRRPGFAEPVARRRAASAGSRSSSWPTIPSLSAVSKTREMLLPIRYPRSMLESPQSRLAQQTIPRRPASIGS